MSIIQATKCQNWQVTCHRFISLRIFASFIYFLTGLLSRRSFLSYRDLRRILRLISLEDAKRCSNEAGFSHLTFVVPWFEQPIPRFPATYEVMFENSNRPSSRHSPLENFSSSAAASLISPVDAGARARAK